MSVRLQAEALVRLLLGEGVLRPMSEWPLFSFRDAHGIQEFQRHVALEDMDEQIAMVKRMKQGGSQIEVPDTGGWYLLMPNGYAIEGMGNEGRTWIGKQEAIMPRLQRVENPYMTPNQTRLWKRAV